MSAASPITADAAAVERAAELLRAGRTVAFPTETVYGLGADATNGDAVLKIYEAKDRPRFNPLISHFADADAVAAQARMTEAGAKLADAFWPGPLTLVLTRRDDCRLSDLVSAGLPTAACRVPAHALARDLLTACGSPLAAPSANPSGRISPTTAAHVADGFAGRDTGPAMILDGGACAVGLESTVVDVSGDVPTCLRPGGLSLEELRRVVPDLVMTDTADPTAPKSPGMLARHYAPRAPLRLNAFEAGPGELLLGFGPSTPPDAAANLSETGDTREAAANLFSMLHALDARHPCTIAVMPIPEDGLGQAINDRLKRGAEGVS